MLKETIEVLVTISKVMDLEAIRRGILQKATTIRETEVAQINQTRKVIDSHLKALELTMMTVKTMVIKEDQMVMPDTSKRNSKKKTLFTKRTIGSNRTTLTVPIILV